VPRFLKFMSRLALLLGLAVAVSGCTGWIERNVSTASRAIDCAVLAAADAPRTFDTAHCGQHPAAQGGKRGGDSAPVA